MTYNSLERIRYTPVNTYLQDSENDNYYTMFNTDYDVALILRTTRQPN